MCAHAGNTRLAGKSDGIDTDSTQLSRVNQPSTIVNSDIAFRKLIMKK